MATFMKRATIYKIFSNIPQLETERLILRKMLVLDTDDMYSYAHRADVTRYLTWNPHPNKNYTREYLEYISTRYVSGEFYDWAIIEKKSRHMIGTCGFTRFDFHSNGAEVGYVLNPQYWGQGYAPEALRAVMDFGFDEIGLVRIEAKYMEGNTASRRVMEKVGMTYEGMFRSAMLVRSEYKNICVCSILSEEYKNMCEKTAYL